MSLVILIGVSWACIALWRSTPDDFLKVGLPLAIVLALGFEETASRAARLRLRLGTDLTVDMTSVWSLAAAVAFAPGAAVVLLTVLFAYLWFRQQRPAGAPAHRMLFTDCSIMIACLTALSVGQYWHLHVRLFDKGFSASMWVLVAIVVASLVNRGLVTLALLGAGVRGRALLGTRDENLVELASQCLGGLVATAMLYHPWLAVLVVAPMVTLQRGALMREFEVAATVDAKTGMLNAVSWELMAQRELARGERERYPVAVLIVDIDRFKTVNDRFGHLAGDLVLKAVGRALTSGVREYDTVARFGGEEFVAVLPEADDASALVVAERLRSRVSQLRISEVVEGLENVENDSLTISIGVANSWSDGTGLSELLYTADAALYRAKNAGRNRIELADRGTSQSGVPADRG